MTGLLAYRVPELAEVLDIDPRTVRKGIADGTIPHVRIGNTILIPRAPVLALFGVTEIEDEPQDRAAAVATDSRPEELSTQLSTSTNTSESTRDRLRIA